MKFNPCASTQSSVICSLHNKIAHIAKYGGGISKVRDCRATVFKDVTSRKWTFIGLTIF